MIAEAMKPIHAERAAKPIHTKQTMRTKNALLKRFHTLIVPSSGRRAACNFLFLLCQWRYRRSRNDDSSAGFVSELFDLGNKSHPKGDLLAIARNHYYQYSGIGLRILEAAGRSRPSGASRPTAIKAKTGDDMTELTPAKDWVRMRDNIQQAVLSLDVCWKCQRVTECQKYILGNMVLVWLCQGCLEEMEDARPEQPRSWPRRTHRGKASRPNDSCEV